MTPGCRRIAAFDPSFVVHECDIGGAFGRRIGDAFRWRLRWQAAGLLPVDVVGGAQHGVLHARAAHVGLMVIVADGVIVGKPFEERRLAFLNIVEAQRIAAGIVARGADIGI